MKKKFGPRLTMTNSQPDNQEYQIKKTLFQTALRYLGYRDRFVREIELRLKKQIIKKKYPESSLDLIPNILAKLDKAGLINDQALINTYIKNQQTNKLRGPYVIKQKLLQMGAQRDLIDIAIAKYISDETQSISIDKLLKKKKPDLKDYKSIAKFQRFLVYRGFTLNLIKKKVAFTGQKE